MWSWTYSKSQTWETQAGCLRVGHSPLPGAHFCIIRCQLCARCNQAEPLIRGALGTPQSQPGCGAECSVTEEGSSLTVPSPSTDTPALKAAHPRQPGPHHRSCPTCGGRCRGLCQETEAGGSQDRWETTEDRGSSDCHSEGPAMAGRLGLGPHIVGTLICRPEVLVH